MRLSLPLAGLSLLASVSVASRPAKRSYDTHTYYVLGHDPSVGTSVEDCAAALGAEIVEPAGELKDHWLLRTHSSNDQVMDALLGLQSAATSGSSHKREFSVVHSIKHLSAQVPRQRVKRAVVPLQRVPAAIPVVHSPARDIAQRFGIQDPLFMQQWHLVNEDYPEHMVNATPVWEMGITGEGVISALVDDGLEYESEDLAANFDVAGSYDFNDHVDLPAPKRWNDHHGTRCAGQIAAGKNSACGVGIAYKSKVAGLRILSGPISDVDEAAALNYGYQNTSIYSCSWGPTDDGKSMEAPGYLIARAMVNGVQNGRGGKGSVFVFASGNGAFSGDQCNFDGYTNSIYSVTVASIDHKGLHPYYSEACAANMVVSYSSGLDHNKHIVTTDMGKNKCTDKHGGTSAAAPNAVGIFALALSARPELTWRDIQHLCYVTARVVNPQDPDWERTTAGRLYSYKYGFGKLDAYDYVTAALTWKLVKPQAWVEMPVVQLGGGTMTIAKEMQGGLRIIPGGVTNSITVTDADLQGNNFEKLEHVTVTVWISHPVRGHVEVEIISPHGVRSVLAGMRSADRHTTGFPGWTFMSLKHWGENPIGAWTIRVSDQEQPGVIGHFLGWKLALWGETIEPEKAKTYVLPWTLLTPFPPPPPSHTDTIEPPKITHPSTTKSYHRPSVTSYAKPTVTYIPTADLEESKTTVTVTATSSVTTASIPPAALLEDDGEENGAFSKAINFVSQRRWTFGAVGVGFILGGLVSTAMFLCRRRRAAHAQQHAGYTAVTNEEDVRMASIDVGPPARLFTRHAQPEDDRDDEHPGPGAALLHSVSPSRVGFHTGFLDNEDFVSPRGPGQYHDVPEEDERENTEKFREN